MTGSKKPAVGAVPRRAAYSVREACQLLGGIGIPTLYEEINAGRLRTFKIQSRRLISEKAILDYIEAAEREASGRALGETTATE